MPTASEVVSKAADAAFGQPLVTNTLRGLLVEAMIASVLDARWTWCGADWASWDFERDDGLRLEVKQSAVRQTWAPPVHGKVYTTFDIRERTGRWEGASFVVEHGRSADTYVFAYHAVTDQSADHREPGQWTFYIVRTAQLPPPQRISIAGVKRLANGIHLSQLSDALAAVSRDRA